MSLSSDERYVIVLDPFIQFTGGAGELDGFLPRKDIEGTRHMCLGAIPSV